MERKWEPMTKEKFRQHYYDTKTEDLLHELHVEFVQCANQMWNTQTTVRNVIESQNELNGQQSTLVLSLSERVLQLEQMNLKFADYVKQADTPIGHDRRLRALEKREGLGIAVAFVLGIIFGTGLIR